ncbi:uncharacterized protein LOC118938705 [Oncorhynchus mykiss]|uniref:uncharacterized protein LOC118938705 n=1 Tax=Oncorhynchus mykiss TaxID=8022 RepID=UPI001878D20F|nr:uncharacterized protein LOC118938705 [Oncorhynchus mykiss]
MVKPGWIQPSKHCPKVRCFEEDNDSLEAQICELQERLAGQQTTSTVLAVPECSLDDMERLLKERDWSLCDVEELRRELDCLQEQYEQTVQQRTLIRLEWEDVGLTVQNMVVPVEGPAAAGREVLEFYNPDILDIKEYYSRLAETLQCEFKETGVVVVVVNVGAGKALAVARAAGVTAVAQITDVNELKKLIVELEKEVTELER